MVVETGITDPFVHNPPDLNQHFYEVRAKNFSCYTTSAPVNFTEVYDAPALPTMDSFAEVDGCVQNGIKIYFTGGTPSTRHDLYKDFTLVQSNVTSPVTYDPGDTASHWYHIRTYNNTCYNQPMPAQYADEVWPPPTQPAITTITDLDPCQMSGIEVYFNEGAPATRHDLYIDGIEAVHGPFTSPLTYLAPDALPHTYTIRAYNNSCFTASAGVVGTDANNTAIPVISGPHENTCPSETVTLTTQSGMSDYQWYSYGSPLGGEISDTIVIGMGGDGSYSVSFANAGCSATSSEHLVTIMPCPAAPPPAPDGSGGTEPVRVAKLQDDGSQLRVTWDAHSCPAADYGIVWGNLSEVSSYLLQGGICSHGTSESFRLAVRRRRRPLLLHPGGGGRRGEQLGDDERRPAVQRREPVEHLLFVEEQRDDLSVRGKSPSVPLWQRGKYKVEYLMLKRAAGSRPFGVRAERAVALFKIEKTSWIPLCKWGERSVGVLFGRFVNRPYEKQSILY